MSDAREEYLRQHPEARKVDQQLVGVIVERVHTFCRHVQHPTPDWIVLLGYAVNIGAYVHDLMESLPGKQMTLDFWSHYEPKFKHADGMQISRDQLKCFVRIAHQKLT